jgi:regulator of sigma E protease
MDFFLVYVPAFLALLTILVFVHELGHYWVARRCNVRVETFSIGFGPEIFGWTDRVGTRWKFSAIPLGGYVKMFGETEMDGSASSEPMTPEEEAVSFSNKSVGKRAAIVAAGPLANYAFAIVVLASLYMTVGQPYTPALVGSVVEGSAAAEAGLKDGDRFVRVAGKDVDRFEDVQTIVRIHPNERVEIVVERNGELHTLTATPKVHEIKDVTGKSLEIGLLGVRQSGKAYELRNPVSALFEATKESINLTYYALKTVGQMIVGKRDIRELGGPVRIGQISGDVALLGFIPFISLVAMLSINLGMINLFPIPMLDGGHLLFYVVEAIRGKPLAIRTQEIGLRIGLVLVLGLMLFVTINDLVNL